MDVGSLDQNSVTLLPHEVSLLQSKDMTLFEITDIVLVNDTMQKTGIRMTIVMKRKIMSEMMTTYFPSLLLMLITYATTYFKPFFFEAALSVNLTTMLVMTTIFISKMESLPPTSDIKMIDIWLIFCQIYPFVEVVLLTAMEYQRAEESDKKKKRKKRKSKVATVKSTWLVDENENLRTRWEKFAAILSRCKVPGLKTLGRKILI